MIPVPPTATTTAPAPATVAITTLLPVLITPERSSTTTRVKIQPIIQRRTLNQIRHRTHFWLRYPPRFGSLPTLSAEYF